MKAFKWVASILAGVVAVGLCALLFVEKIDVGNVGVVYSVNGVQDEVLSQGWKIMPPWKNVKEYPISQQQLVLSNNPSDYNTDEHADWSIDAPTQGGIITLNMTVNYQFMPDRVVDLYKKFNGMDGNTLVETMVQNSIVAYTKEVTPRFTVMEIYSEARAEVSEEVTKYLNDKMRDEYGIEIKSALIIDVQLNDQLLETVQAQEVAKQQAINAQYQKETALAEAETERVRAQTAADIKLIEAQAEADANKIVSQSITPELIQMTEAEARMKHGWVTVTGSNTVAVKP